MTRQAIDYMQIRGGSSKGLFFRAGDVPAGQRERDAFLVAAMGSGERQIDGLGGGHSLTSKVALVAPPSRDDADLDYLFCQVVVGEDRVDTTPTCGNILAGVGVFALESGMVEAVRDETRLVVNMLNSGKLCELVMRTPGGRFEDSGDAVIAGVPGSASPIVCNYRDVEGSACGALLPTGNPSDLVLGTEVTCIDNGMPLVVMRAADMGISGYESPAELNANRALKERLQAIRLQLGPMMNLGDVDGAAVPKMCMVSPAKHGGVVNTRTFIPYSCHEAIGVLGAVSVATACLLPGSVAQGVAQEVRVQKGQPVRLAVEHPSGEFACVLEAEAVRDGIKISSAGVVRTARLLSRGQLFVPDGLAKERAA